MDRYEHNQYMHTCVSANASERGGRERNEVRQEVNSPCQENEEETKDNGNMKEARERLHSRLLPKSRTASPCLQRHPADRFFFFKKIKSISPVPMPPEASS
jgi:hypothetical protein